MSQNPYGYSNSLAPNTTGEIPGGLGLFQPLINASGWIKLSGWVMIITGILQCLSIFGIIVAWLPIWMGFLLKRAGDSLSLARQTNNHFLIYSTAKDLGLYFTIIGVLTIIGLIMTVLFIGLAIMLNVGVAAAAAGAAAR